MVFAPGEKSGKELEEVKLQNTSKQIVQNAILQAMRQVSQESLRRKADPVTAGPGASWEGAS